jgi:hypothetical protein
MYIASFAMEYQLTMTVDGAGSVTPPSGWFDAGDAVTIRANPDAGQSFVRWDGSGDGSYSGTDNPAHITMNGPIAETAHFSGGATTREVTVTADPPGRRLTVDGEDVTFKRVYNWEVGSAHELSTTSPQSGAPGLRYVWTSWSDGGEMTHSWTVPAGNAMTLTANFDMECYLTMSAGSGGSVNPESSWHDENASVEIRAVPNAGYRFDRWEGSGENSYSGTLNPVTITMGNPITETAVFASVTDAETTPALPQSVTLGQCTPNPCSSVAVIPFTLTRTAPASLVVMDLLGREILRIGDGNALPAGWHEARIDVSGLSSGVYIYRLESANAVRVRTMVVLR